jgi:hypothetical protein
MQITKYQNGAQNGAHRENIEKTTRILGTRDQCQMTTKWRMAGDIWQIMDNAERMGKTIGQYEIL